jgi:hypothetical protein
MHDEANDKRRAADDPPAHSSLNGEGASVREECRASILSRLPSLDVGERQQEDLESCGRQLEDMTIREVQETTREMPKSLISLEQTVLAKATSVVGSSGHEHVAGSLVDLEQHVQERTSVNRIPLEEVIPPRIDVQQQVQGTAKVPKTQNVRQAQRPDDLEEGLRVTADVTAEVQNQNELHLPICFVGITSGCSDAATMPKTGTVASINEGMAQDGGLTMARGAPAYHAEDGDSGEFSVGRLIESIQPLPSNVGTRESQPGAFAIAGGVRTNSLYHHATPHHLDSHEGQANVGQSALVNQVNEVTSSSAALPNLAEAHLVTECGRHEIPTAVEHPQDSVESARQTKRKNAAPSFAWAGGAFMVILVISILTVLATSRSEGLAPAPMPSITESPSAAPSLSLESRVKDILNWHTIDSFDTPQYRAFEWLVNDPLLGTFPDWRLRQRFALASLFYSTSGSSWINNDGWLSYSIHECQWYSLESFDSFIDADYINVTHYNPCEEDPEAPGAMGVYRHIWLRENNLRGRLPSELFTLTSLRSINVHANMLTGTISSHLGQLTNIEALSLVANSFSGYIPTEIGLLHNATGIWMIANYLEGTVSLFWMHFMGR